MRKLFVLCLILSSTAPLQAKRLQCMELFAKNYAVDAFYIPLATKKQSKQFVALAVDRVMGRASLDEVLDLVALISVRGPADLTDTQKKLILDFRQDTSLLRTAFQLNDQKHESPSQFADFVRDFGKMKDAILINENQIARVQALIILKKYVDLDIYSELDKISYSSKKSTQKYLKKQVKTIRALALRNSISVDEFHDIRKAVREILRYLEIHQEMTQGQEKNELNEDTQSLQIKFLKKFNQQLGEICDENAGLILQGRLKKNSEVRFPTKLREKAIYLSEKVIFEEDGSHD